MMEVSLLAELAGFSPTEEDRRVFDDVFAVDAKGNPEVFRYHLPRTAATMRQLACCTLGWLYLTGERSIMWTTHKYSTAEASFKMLTDAVERSPELFRRVAKIRRAYGAEEICLVNGPRLIMRARNLSLGRGYWADRLIISEEEYLTESQYDSLVPLLAGRANSQIVCG